MSHSNRVYTDRTRTIAYQRCHRLGWLTSYEGGRGLQRKSLNAHLLIGTHVHAGINLLFTGVSIEQTISHLHGMWDVEVVGKTVEECLSEYQVQLLNDCWNLVEGQVRAFELVMLPRILDEYEILDTEKEECYVLDAANTNAITPVGHYYPDIMWMARLDATLRQKMTGDIGPLSIKTTGRWDKRKEEAAKHDMQGCSEMWTLQQRQRTEDHVNAGGDVMFVQMLYILKGNKKLNEATGQWEFQSPLTKGYRRPIIEPQSVSSISGVYEWAHSYWWTCKEMHVKGYSKKGEAQWCEGNKKHNCQGWEQVDIATGFDGGIKGWIDALQARAIQPNAQETASILEQQFVLPAPVYRGQQEIDRWKRATVAEKRRIIKNAQTVNAIIGGAPEHKEEILDELFPMYTHSCDYPSRCAMTEICHEGLSDPVGSGLFEARKANHPIEEAE